MTSISPETHARIQFPRMGAPLEIVQVPKPALEPDQVLIRNRVIALNLIDSKQRELGIGIQHWPHVLGVEGAGVVEEMGSGVKQLQVGDEVMAWEGGGALDVTWGGSYQERVAVPTHFLAKKPKNTSWETAASLVVGFVTAGTAIVNGLKVPLPFIEGTTTHGHKPSSILVLGGSSVTGTAAIQLLRLAYPSLPILATSSSKHHDRLRDLGVTHMFDYGSGSVVADIKATSPPASGVDMILDCVGAGASQMDICNVFDPAGSKRYAAVVTGATIQVPEGVTRVYASADSMLDMEGGKQLIWALTKLIENGTYKVPLPVRVVGHGLEELSQVMDEIKTVSGEKVVVTM